MTLNEKRKVIEVLLCTANGNELVSVCGARTAVGLGYKAVWDVIDSSYRKREPLRGRFVDRLHEVAYRLIESSATLRREWFGGR